MPVLVDPARCDGSPDCPSVKWCPSGALTYNAEAKKLDYDRSVCTDCGKCVTWCEPGAIYRVETDAEWEFLKQELERSA